MRRGQGFELLLVIGQLLLQGGKLLNQLPKHLLAQGVSLSFADSSLPTTVCRNFDTPLGITIPYSCSSPCTSFTKAVRAPMSRSRTRWSAWISCWSTSLTGTKRMVVRVTASAIASASRLSFLFDLTYGLTNCGAMSFTSWPYARKRRAQ